MNLFIIPSFFFMISSRNIWQHKDTEMKIEGEVPPLVFGLLLLVDLFKFLSFNMLLPWHWFWVLLFSTLVIPFISIPIVIIYNFTFGVKRKNKNPFYNNLTPIDYLNTSFIAFAIGVVSLIICFIINQLEVNIVMGIIIAIVIGVVVFKFIGDFIRYYKEQMQEDREELSLTSVEDKFSIIVNGLNEYCYKGEGQITKFNKGAFNLYKRGSCQIISFQYLGGALRVIWRFKYFQQEMIYKKEFLNARVIDDEWQEKALRTLISEFLERYKIHEAKVNASGVVDERLSEFGINKENYKKAKEFLE